MNEQWRVSQTCTALGASQASGVCRALMVTYDKVVADKELTKDERAGVTWLLGPARARLAASVEALEGAVAAQQGGDAEVQPAPSSALVAYRAPWRTLRDGLKRAVRVEKETGASGAAELDASVFGGGNGIPFLKGAPHAVWTDAGKAIDTLRGEAATVVLARHHLTGHFDRVQGAHLTYARAIGATGSLVPAAAVGTSVREALGVCTAALCDYVTRACAVEDEARPGSAQLLSRLLAALESVPRVHERAPKAAENEETGDEGTTDEVAKDDDPPENDDADAEPEATRKVG
jgi:hypothetical protein